MNWAGFPETPMNDKSIDHLGSHSEAMAQAGQESVNVEAERGSGLGTEIQLGFPVRAYCSLDGSLAISE
jgi:hypothetical protein